MKATDLTRAIASARSAASAAGLAAAEAVILQNSNKLSLRLLPCNTLARVSLDGEATAQFEVDLAAALSRAGCPSGALDPRVSPGVYLHDGFAVTFWTYYEQSQAEIPPADYADALQKLHASMRELEIPAPRYTDRVDDARRLLQDQAKTPDLSGDDRAFLNTMLHRITRDIADRSAPEQLLHGEPHAGNVLNTFLGPLLIDLETCCRGPVEFDLAHVPDAVVDHYPQVDEILLGKCRALVLIMVAAWRWDADDQFPGGRRWARDLLDVLRKGPPWPSLETMNKRLSHLSR